jgi:hypothetical protein
MTTFSSNTFPTDTSRSKVVMILPPCQSMALGAHLLHILSVKCNYELH